MRASARTPGPCWPAFADAGYQTEETDQTWLYKATRDGVLVDLIFESTGGIVLDDEMLSRVRQGTFEHLRLNVLGPEDLLVIKAIVHREHRQRHWFDALALVETGELDWPYLLRRAAPGPRRVASLLLYAQTDGLQVPDWVIESLLEQAREQEAGAGVPEEYLVAHAGEALAATHAPPSWSSTSPSTAARWSSPARWPPPSGRPPSPTSWPRPCPAARSAT